MSKKKMSKRPRGRPKQAFRLKRVTLTLDPDDWKNFEKLSHDSSMSTAALIRLAMKEFLHRRRSGMALEVRIGR
jgi:hypothetical protein